MFYQISLIAFALVSFLSMGGSSCGKSDSAPEVAESADVSGNAQGGSSSATSEPTPQPEAPKPVDPMIALRATLFEAINKEDLPGIAQSFKNTVALKAGSLHMAVVANKPNVAKILLETHHVEVDGPDADGLTALLVAAKTGNLELFKQLADAGAKIDAKTPAGKNALFLAAESGSLDLVKHIYGKAKDQLEGEAQNGQTPLFGAAAFGHSELIKHFHSISANFRVVDKSGETPLFVAARSVDDAATILELTGAKYTWGTYVLPNAANAKGETAIFAAAAAGHTKAIDALKEAKAVVKKLNENDETALFAAGRAGKADAIAHLKTLGLDVLALNKNGESLAQVCAQSEQLDALKKVFELAYTDVNVARSKKTELLHVLIAKHDTKQDAKKIADSLKTIRTVLSSVPGDKSVVVDELGNNALHIAARNGKMSLLKTLVEAGYILTKPNKAGHLPYSVAAEVGAQTTLKEILTMMGKDAQAVMPEAILSGNVKAVNALKTAGAVFTKENFYSALQSGSVAIATEMVKDPAVVADKLLLFSAAEAGHAEAVKTLLAVKPALKSEKNDNQETVLHVAAKKNQVAVLDVLLPAMRPEIEAKNAEGDTPFLLAVMEQSIEAMETLQKAGANVAALDANGLPPNYIAAQMILAKSMKKLVDLNVDPLGSGTNGVNIIHKIATECQDADLAAIEGFNTLGHDVFSQDKAGETPIFGAVRNGQVKCIELFKKLNTKNLDIVRANQGVKSLLYAAAKSNKPESLKALKEQFGLDVKAHDSNGRLLTTIAAEHYDLEALVGLVAAGVDINSADANGLTPVVAMTRSTLNHEGVDYNFAKQNLNKLTPEALRDAGHASVIAALTDMGSKTADARRAGFKKLKALGAALNHQDAKGQWQESALYEAVLSGDRVIFDDLSNAFSVSLGDTDALGQTLMHLAAVKGHGKAVENLKRFGLSINVANAKGETPLFAAVRHIATLSDDEATKYAPFFVELQKKGADVTTENSASVTAAYIAAQLQSTNAAKALMAAFTGVNKDAEADLHDAVLKDDANAIAGSRLFGVNVDVQDDEGDTALLRAIEAKKLKSIAALKDLGADASKSNKAGHNAFYSAAKSKDSAVMALMQSYGASELTTDAKNEMLHKAVRLGDADAIAGLAAWGASVEALDANKKTPLMNAAELGQLNSVIALLVANASVDAANENGVTAMHLASGAGHWLVVDRLLKAEASLIAVDGKGETALFYAARAGHLDVVENLIRYGSTPPELFGEGKSLNGTDTSGAHLPFIGADPLHINDAGVTVIYAAAQAGQRDVVKRLQSLNVDINALIGKVNNPLHMAAKMGDLVTLDNLIVYGANARELNHEGHSIARIAASAGHAVIATHLAKRALGLDEASTQSPVHAAVLANNLDALLALSAAGVDFGVKEDGLTALHSAAFNGNVVMIDKLVELKPELLEVPSDVTAGKETAIFYAIRAESAEAVEALAAAHAVGNNTVTNGSSKSPLYVAAQLIGAAGSNVELKAERLAVAKQLVTSYSLDVNAPLGDGEDRLVHIAAKADDASALHGLLALNANFSQPNKAGQSALVNAVVQGRANAIRALSEVKVVPEDDIVYLAAKAGMQSSLAALETHFSLGISGLMHQAVLRQDVEAMNGLMARRREIVNAKDADGNSPLHIALRDGKVESMKVLDSAKASWSQINADGLNPVQLFAKVQGQRGVLDQVMVNALTARNVMLDKPSKDSKTTYAHMAAQAGEREIVKGLSLMGLNPKIARDAQGHSIFYRATVGLLKGMIADGGLSLAELNAELREACEHNDQAEVLRLIEGGAEVNSTDDNGETPIFAAVRKNHHGLIVVLAGKGANLKLTNKLGQNALFVAAQLRKNESAKALMDNGVKIDDLVNGKSMMHLAVKLNLPDAVRGLHLLGAKVDVKDADGRTPLFVAAGLGDGNMVERLVNEFGANKNHTDNKGQRLMHVAAAGAVNAILGLETEAKTKKMQAGEMLEYAIRLGRTSSSVARSVIELADREKVLDEVVYNALQFSELRKNANEFKDLRADLTKALPADSRSLVDQTAWFSAVASGHVDVLVALKASGTSVELKNADGDTALFVAARVKQSAVIAKLKDLGANMRQTNKDGRDVLGAMAFEGLAESMALVLAVEGDATAQTNRLAGFIAQEAKGTKWNKTLKSVYAMSDKARVKEAVAKALQALAADTTLDADKRHMTILAVEDVAENENDKKYVKSLPQHISAMVWYDSSWTHKPKWANFKTLNW